MSRRQTNAEARIERRRQFFLARLDRAETATDVINAASNYVQAALAKMPAEVGLQRARVIADEWAGMAEEMYRDV